MGATNETANLKLSQFTDANKPTWLGDYNSDMAKIDAGHSALATSTATANGLSNTALTTANEAKAKADATATTVSTNKAAIDAAVAANKTAIETTVTANKEATDDALVIVNAGLAARYLKTEADDKFALKSIVQPVHAVFLGSSNSLPGQWCEALSATQGWVSHNYSVSGGSFTGAGAGRYDQQLAAALADTSFAKSLVKFVFICDAANDVRAQDRNVLADAAGVFSTARNNYPNARIIVLPALWGPTVRSTPLQNTGWGALSALQKNIFELKTAGLNQGVEIVEGTHTWHWDDASYMLPGEVHYTVAGYTQIRLWMMKYLRGESTWNDTEWRRPMGIAAHDTSVLRVRRVQNTGQLAGTLMLSPGVGIDTDLFTLPAGFSPARPDLLFTVAGIGADRNDYRFQMYDTGLCRAFSAMPLGRVDINVTYPIF